MKRLITYFILSASFLSAAPKGSIKKPDFLKGDKVPAIAVHDWNLGATGARGWIHSDQLTTTDARQIYITKIAKNSPAEKQLTVGDVIIGIGSKVFSSDPRTAIGKAITTAETKGGALNLLRWRNGKTEEISIKLPTLGSYSHTAPYNCPKSKLILDQGCEFIAQKIKKGGARVYDCYW